MKYCKTISAFLIWSLLPTTQKLFSFFLLFGTASLEVILITIQLCILEYPVISSFYCKETKCVHFVVIWKKCLKESLFSVIAFATIFQLLCAVRTVLNLLAKYSLETSLYVETYFLVAVCRHIHLILM